MYEKWDSRIPVKLLMSRIGESTVRDNIQRAIQTQKLILVEGGRLILSPGKAVSESTWIIFRKQTGFNCSFSMSFLFQIAYNQAEIPYRCRRCFKVKVVPGSLRELVELYHIAKRIPVNSKVGPEMDRRESSVLYGGYFYCNGLGQARKIYHLLRGAVDDNPKLGTGVPIFIKRGCSVYEIQCGPSDAWKTRSEFKELEAHLEKVFLKVKIPSSRTMAVDQMKSFLNWQLSAYKVGDNTYLDFTNGKPLYPEAVSYSPTPSPTKKNKEHPKATGAQLG